MRSGRSFPAKPWSNSLPGQASPCSRRQAVSIETGFKHQCLRQKRKRQLDGFRCREQIEQGSGRKTRHLAELVAAAL